MVHGDVSFAGLFYTIQSLSPIYFVILYPCKLQLY